MSINEITITITVDTRKFEHLFQQAKSSRIDSMKRLLPSLFDKGSFAEAIARSSSVAMAYEKLDEIRSKTYGR